MYSINDYEPTLEKVQRYVANLNQEINLETIQLIGKEPTGNDCHRILIFTSEKKEGFPGERFAFYLHYYTPQCSNCPQNCKTIPKPYVKEVILKEI